MRRKLKEKWIRLKAARPWTPPLVLLCLRLPLYLSQFLLRHTPFTSSISGLVQCGLHITELSIFVCKHTEFIRRKHHKSRVCRRHTRREICRNHPHHCLWVCHCGGGLASVRTYEAMLTSYYSLRKVSKGSLCFMNYVPGTKRDHSKSPSCTQCFSYMNEWISLTLLSLGLPPKNHKTSLGLQDHKGMEG